MCAWNSNFDQLIIWTSRLGGVVLSRCESETSAVHVGNSKTAWHGRVRVFGRHTSGNSQKLCLRQPLGAKLECWFESCASHVTFRTHTLHAIQCLLHGHTLLLCHYVLLVACSMGRRYYGLLPTLVCMHSWQTISVEFYTLLIKSRSLKKKL